MAGQPGKANINTVAAELRKIVRSRADGELLGSEDDLTRLLGVSRPTVRQVARLLEREGLLRVRRGINGGYFATRPSVEVIENSVSLYLEMVEADDEELSEIASSLWVIAAGKAAKLQTADKAALVADLKTRVAAVPDTALFDDALAVDEYSREKMFRFINSPYIELIFHINRASASRKFPIRPSDRDGTPEHREFIRTWRTAKLLELDAILCGDRNLAELAARHARNIFHIRLWGHDFRR